MSVVIDAPGIYQMADLPERIRAKVEVVGECWRWTGFCADGYGRTSWPDIAGRLAHRIAYQLLVGPIPDGLELDHTCHNHETCAGGPTCLHRRCINPAHLEPVTTKINVLRGNGPGGRHARKTHCHNGHELTDENTYYRTGKNGTSRCCRECRKGYDADYYKRKKADA